MPAVCSFASFNYYTEQIKPTGFDAVDFIHQIQNKDFASTRETLQNSLDKAGKQHASIPESVKALYAGKWRDISLADVSYMIESLQEGESDKIELLGRVLFAIECSLKREE